MFYPTRPARGTAASAPWLRLLEAIAVTSAMGRSMLPREALRRYPDEPAEPGEPAGLRGSRRSAAGGGDRRLAWRLIRPVGRARSRASGLSDSRTGSGRC